MDDRLARIEDRLRELDQAFGVLCARVSSLERAAGADRVDLQNAVPAATPTPPGEPHQEDFGGLAALPILTLVGRTFVVLGGAFLLRALTGGGQLRPGGGIVLGFVYASAWIGAADHAAIRRPVSGLFHGLAALVIGCPLILEASTRFGVLSPGAAAALLVVFTAGTLAVAWHRRLQSLAGIAAIAGSITTVILAVTTGHVWPFALAAIGVGAMSQVLSTDRGWHWPVRAPAAAAILLVLDLLVRAHAAPTTEPLAIVLTTTLSLAAVYAITLVIAIIAKRDDISILDGVQSLAALVLGVGGAFIVAYQIGPRVADRLGSGLLAFGAGTFIFALSRADRWSSLASAAISTLAAMVFLIGGVSRLSGSPRDLVLGFAAVLMLLLGLRTERVWLIAQSAVFALTLAAASGLMSFAADAWIGDAAPAPAWFPMVLVLIVILFGGVMPKLGTAGPSVVPAVSSFVQIAIATWGLTALGVLFLDALDGRASSASIIAAERSVIAGVAAVALAALSRLRRAPDLKWLAYGVLGLGALKLALVDIRVSSPLAIFVALGAYGAALIVSARLLSGRARPGQ